MEGLCCGGLVITCCSWSGRRQLGERKGWELHWGEPTVLTLCVTDRFLGVGTCP